MSASCPGSCPGHNGCREHQFTCFHEGFEGRGPEGTLVSNLASGARLAKVTSAPVPTHRRENGLRGMGLPASFPSSSPRRFDPAFQFLHKQVCVGHALGRIHGITAISSLFPAASLASLKRAGGIFYNTAVHDVDATCVLLGEATPDTVFSLGHAFCPGKSGLHCCNVLLWHRDWLQCSTGWGPCSEFLPDSQLWGVDKVTWSTCKKDD